MINRFNIRVYGILINNGQLLVSDEYIKKNKITKFPGGGLEFGEGPKDCLIREFKEELNLSIKVIEHYYTTDFCVNSSFDTNSQIISIYYIVFPLYQLLKKVEQKINKILITSSHSYCDIKDIMGFGH